MDKLLDVPMQIRHLREVGRDTEDELDFLQRGRLFHATIEDVPLNHIAKEIWGLEEDVERQGELLKSRRLERAEQQSRYALRHASQVR